ncbi:MAG: UDPGP type 1 family protein [Sedimentisphaerales bacterium]|jgi:UDP-N-acetylglucosamine/UDP-N-acetylgalactosamine diphosphorylase
MSTLKNCEDVKKELEKHNQSHLLAFWNELDQARQQALLAQIDGLDFANIDRWVREFIENPQAPAIRTDFSPPESYGPRPKGTDQQDKYSQAIELGVKLIAAGRVAAFVVAGGQGTRLGFDGPKGDFPIGPVSKRTLFQIFADTIAAVGRKYHVACPWYVMTSPLNHDRTLEVFRSNDYYGLDPKNVFIFEQGTLPNFGFDGKILLADKDQIACSPDGHGGSLKALRQSGALEDMRSRGVELLSYFQVDNPLINIFDPLFVGLHSLDRAEMSSKALEKSGPKEKVGNFCLIDGKVTIIEYSDLADEQAEKRKPDGSLVFHLGSIAIHMINRTFVERLTAGDLGLPLHRAVKSIPHLDERGEMVESKGVKLESFIFDAVPLASKSIILETLREEEFAPTKNTTGVDSAETSKQMIVARAAEWLESTGVAVPRKPDGSPDCLLEIASSFALDREEVKEKVDQIPAIKRGAKIYLA